VLDVHLRCWSWNQKFVEHTSKLAHRNRVAQEHIFERVIKFDGQDVLGIVKAPAFDVAARYVLHVSQHTTKSKDTQDHTQDDSRPKSLDPLILGARPDYPQRRTKC
jgi:hypothetical protein